MVVYIGMQRKPLVVVAAVVLLAGCAGRVEPEPNRVVPVTVTDSSEVGPTQAEAEEAVWRVVCRRSEACFPDPKSGFLLAYPGGYDECVAAAKPPTDHEPAHCSWPELAACLDALEDSECPRTMLEWNATACDVCFP